SFIENENIELFFVGGKILPEYKMAVGPITRNTLSMFNFDNCFISCAGIDPDTRMVYTADMETMDIKNQVLKQSVNKYLLIDSSKLHIKGFCSFIDSNDFDAIICDGKANLNEDDVPLNYIIVDEIE
ncbi:MAG: DeoR family transcriptional regulator, partial [Holdemanella sp.]|nr:DeoR family transcriptional regulator [Holdemanella sp.]